MYIDRLGPLRHAAGVAFVCLGAANSGVRPERYRKFAKRQLHYMLGDGGLVSYVVGYGPSPPTRPWHRCSKIIFSEHLLYFLYNHVVFY